MDKVLSFFFSCVKQLLFMIMSIYFSCANSFYFCSGKRQKRSWMRMRKMNQTILTRYWRGSDKGKLRCVNWPTFLLKYLHVQLLLGSETRLFVQEWKAKQITSGEAKDNANFQPLGGDWYVITILDRPFLCVQFRFRMGKGKLFDLFASINMNHWSIVIHICLYFQSYVQLYYYLSSVNFSCFIASLTCVLGLSHLPISNPTALAAWACGHCLGCIGI